MTTFRAIFLLVSLICMGGVSGAFASEPPFFDMTGRPQSRALANVANAQTYGLKDSRGYFMGLVIGDGPHDFFEVGPGGKFHLKPDQEGDEEKK